MFRRKKKKKNHKKLSIVLYNTLFGGVHKDQGFLLDIVTFLYCTFRIHKFYPLLKKDLKRSLKFAVRGNPDVIVLTELITGSDLNSARRFFRRRGYKSIVTGKSKFFEKHEDDKNFAVLTVFKGIAQKVHLKNYDVQPCWGSSVMYIPAYNLMIFSLHMSVLKIERYREIASLQKVVLTQMNKGRRIMLVGDFNTNIKEILSYFPNLYPSFINKATFDHWLFGKDNIDNIVIFGGKHKKVRLFQDTSDHKKIFSRIIFHH